MFSAGRTGQVSEPHFDAYRESPAQLIEVGGVRVRGAANVGLFSSWAAGNHITLRAGIDNLFDRQPEVVGYTPGVTNALGSTAAGFYDLLGRRYYAGVNVRF